MDKIAITKRAIRIQAWEKMYEEYQLSGMKVKDWCDEQGLSIKTKVLMQGHCKIKCVSRGLSPTYAL